MNEFAKQRRQTINGTKNPSEHAAELNRARVKKHQAKLDDIKFRVPKGEREKWKEFAAQNDTSLQQLIIGMMHDAMDKAGFDYTLPKEDER